MSANNEGTEIIVLLKSVYQNLVDRLEEKSQRSSGGKKNLFSDKILQEQLEARLFPNVNSIELQKRNLWLSEIYAFEKYFEDVYRNFLALLRADELEIYVENIAKKEKYAYLAELDNLSKMTREKQLESLKSALKNLDNIIKEIEKRIEKLLLNINSLEKENEALKGKVENNNEKIGATIQDIYHSISDSKVTHEINFGDENLKISDKEIIAELSRYFKGKFSMGDIDVTNIFAEQATVLEAFLRSKLSPSAAISELGDKIKDASIDINNHLKKLWNENPLANIVEDLIDETKRLKTKISQNDDKISLNKIEIFSLEKNQENALKLENMVINSMHKAEIAEAKIATYLTEIDIIKKININNKEVGVMFDNVHTEAKRDRVNTNENRQAAKTKSYQNGSQENNSNNDSPPPYNPASGVAPDYRNPPPYNLDAAAPRPSASKAGDSWVGGGLRRAVDSDKRPEDRPDDNANDPPPRYKP
jgi:hypothetical protein